MAEIKLPPLEIKMPGGGSGGGDGLKKLKEDIKSMSDNMSKGFSKISDAIKAVYIAQSSFAKSTEKIVSNFTKQMTEFNKALNVAEVRKNALLKDYRLATSVLGRTEDKLSERQVSKLEKQLNKFSAGDINTNEFNQNVSKISKVYAKAFSDALAKSTMGENALKLSKAELENEGKYANQRAKAAATTAESEEKIREAQERSAALLKEAVKQEEIKTRSAREQADIKTRELARQEASKSDKAAHKAETEAQRELKARRATEDYLAASDAREVRRQQKLAENERARATLYQQLGSVMSGAYDGATKSTQKAELASKRLLETMRHIQEFAETEGYTGTVGLESTDVLRAQQYYDTVMKVAVEWKRVNSQEGKTADMLSRISTDMERFRSSVNRIHTGLGQLASSFSSVAGIAKQFRQTMMQVVQPVTQMVTRLASKAFQDSLEALKNMELSEIGFGNFFGQFEVEGIMSNIKQNALLSPLSAAQLASYVNQIAPLSNGNSTLATNAAMGVAKMIQYSGGEVSTEMEYVIRNLRDVISKGKATSIDIRQFNRAMPALKKVLQDMGLEDFLKDGELSISPETAPKLLEAFQKINESEDVGSIFDKTSVTISGLIERLQEQIELLVIDVADFSGATDWIKNTLHDLLEDENGWLTTVKSYLSFIGNDVMRWVKSRDWEHFGKTLSEIFNIFKEGLGEGLASIKEALGGTDFADTLKNIAKVISEFVKGIAKSYSWLINIIKGMSNSGFLGSGILQAGMGVMGFMSGNAGTLLTGVARGAGNFMGVFNQAITSAIKVVNSWQSKMLETATTVSTFDEAIALASKASTDLAADFSIMQQMMSGNMSAEEANVAMTEIETRSKERLVAAQEANIASEQAETAANEAAAASENVETSANTAGFGAGLLGKVAGGGTKLGSIIGKVGSGAVWAMLAGILGNSLGSGATSLVGGNKYQAEGIGASLGNVAGGAVAGGAIGSVIPVIGTAAGAIVGAIGGVVKSIFDVQGILEERRQDELEAVEAQVNSGDYVRQLLEKTTEGQRVTSGDFDKINAAAVHLMNEFNETFPYGTADALLEFLAETAYNGETLNDMVAASNKSREQNANDLWDAIANETIDKESGEFLANEIAATLYDAGYDNSDITSMVLEKAVQAGLDSSQIADVMTKWSSVQTTGGEDLTRDYLMKLKNGSKEDQAKFDMYQTQLSTLFHTVMKNVLKDSTLSEEEKVELSKQMSDTWVDILTDSLNTDDKEGIFSLTRLFQQSGVDAKNNPFNLGITDTDVSNLDNYKVSLYGLDKNWDTWSKKIYNFSEGVTWYTDTIKNKMDDFYGKTSAAATGIDSLKTSIQKLGNSASIANSNMSPLLTNLDIANNNAINNQNNKYGGGLIYRAAGGGVRGVDTVPAMLQTGEFVVRRSAVSKVGLSAMNALNTGDLGYFTRAIGRQNIYGDYSNARTWNNTNNDNRKSVSNVVKVYNNSKGARLNRYYSLANRLA